MRRLTVIILLTLTGCVDRADEAAASTAMGFEARYESEACEFTLQLGPGETVRTGDDLEVETRRLDIQGRTLADDPCAATPGRVTIWLDVTGREVRRFVQHCHQRCPDEGFLIFAHAGGALPFGIDWPVASTIRFQSEVPVVIDKQDGWSSVRLPAPEGFPWIDDPTLDPQAWAWRPGDRLPSALRITTEEGMQEFTLAESEETELPSIAQPPEPSRQRTSPVERPVPDLTTDLFHFGLTAEDVLSLAAQDSQMGALLERGCVTSMRHRGSGFGAAPAGLPAGSEGITIEVIARDDTHALAGTAIFTKDRTTGEINEQFMVSDEPARPGPCQPLAMGPDDLATVIDKVWDLPFGKAGLPCSWGIHQPAMPDGIAPFSLIQYRYNGHPETGTFWGRDPHDRVASEFITAGYDVTHGRWSHMFVEQDSLASFDRFQDFERTFTHDDQYASWCRYDATEI